MELMQANRQWSSRPADERFTSLLELDVHCQTVRRSSAAKAVPSNLINAAPVASDSKALVIMGPSGNPVDLTHWSFSQLCTRAGAPAGYLRTLSGDLAARNLNEGLRNAPSEQVGLLLRRDGNSITLRAATSPTYGRVWNADVTRALVDRFGDGITGDFRVPGEFGKAVTVTKDNTTLYASDRDLFVFLADEVRRIDMPNRRNGKSGSLARGFFLTNSEVGAGKIGVATFLFDYVCCNRIVWGAEGFQEISMRHTSGAPARWLAEITPALHAYAQSSATGVQHAITLARTARIPNVDSFLTDRKFSRPQVAAIKAAHFADEGRPMETVWDVTTGVTAFARSIEFQNDRVAMEREAGRIMALASGRKLLAAA